MGNLFGCFSVISYIEGGATMGTLRIHFTAADLARTHVAAEPDPFWEIVLSLHVLQGEFSRWRYPEWRQTLPTGKTGTELHRIVRTTLMPVARPGPYFPDFLTPIEGLAGFDAGLETILRTPRRRAQQELGRLSPTAGEGPWLTALAHGDARHWKQLGHVLRTYFQQAMSDFWPTVKTRLRMEYTLRARLYADQGAAGLLGSLHPQIAWNPPVLEVTGPWNRDVALGGQGLTLVPSYFNCHNPMPLFDPGLPQVLVYPAARLGSLLHDPDPTPGKELADLIGPTRAAILRDIRHGRTTTELAKQTGVSLATASEHATVLRRAGLVHTQRDRQAVLHTLTPLGTALVAATANQRAPVDRPSPKPRVYPGRKDLGK